jgi:adenosine kinase
MHILISGSIAFDYLMVFPGLFKEHLLPEHLEKVSLSFLVDSLVKRRGGIAPNIAYTMALLNGQASILATAGNDFSEYGAWLKEHGVDISTIKIIDDKLTASFFATTDQSNAQVASFYPGAMQDAATLSLSDLKTKPDLLLISPNDPAAMEKLVSESKALKIPYIYDPSQQIVRASGKTLSDGLEGALAMFANEYEFEMIKKKTGLQLAEVLSHLEFLIITLGPKGALVYYKDGLEEIEAYPTENIVDPTGGGDAFRAGFLTGYRLGFDWSTCGRMGSLAATYCLENDGPQGHHFTVPEFIKRYSEQYDNGEQLKALL